MQSWCRGQEGLPSEAGASWVTCGEQRLSETPSWPPLLAPSPHISPFPADPHNCNQLKKHSTTPPFPLSLPPSHADQENAKRPEISPHLCRFTHHLDPSLKLSLSSSQAESPQGWKEGNSHGTTHFADGTLTMPGPARWPEEPREAVASPEP